MQINMSIWRLMNGMYLINSNPSESQFLAIGFTKGSAVFASRRLAVRVGRGCRIISQLGYYTDRL